MIGLYIFGLIINTIAVILTGCSSVSFYLNGNMPKALLEALLCIMNICFFIMNTCNLRNEIK